MSKESEHKKRIQVRIPADVISLMKQWSDRENQLAAARGTFPMPESQLVTVLFVFCYGKDPDLKKEALRTLGALSPQVLIAAIERDDALPEVLDLIARVRFRDPLVIKPLLSSPKVPLKTLFYLAERASGEVRELVAGNEQALLRSPLLRTLVVDRPVDDSGSEAEVEQAPGEDAAGGPDEGDEFEEMEVFEKEEELSKYQQLLEMPVAEKIKLSMTGDKEWRTLLLRESNKLVTSAVLKNPRISESEVIAVAKNRASNDEMIRLILLNKEWVKLYQIKKALAVHPRTPLQKALRFLGFLTEKDLKDVARSKQVPQAIVNGARRLLSTKGGKR